MRSCVRVVLVVLVVLLVLLVLLGQAPGKISSERFENCDSCSAV